MHIFPFYNDFSARTHCGGMPQALYFQNGNSPRFACIYLIW